MFKIVLYQPEIPANTGNIGRLCVGSGSELHLIKPMRFLLNDKYLKRAGLDYWSNLKLYIHSDLAELVELQQQNKIYYCTTKARHLYTEPVYKPGDAFVFGPESRGLPEELLLKNAADTVAIPMSAALRSLNLSNSVAILLYEALRQIHWKGDENTDRRIIC
ncbi:MAG: tRNA (cytidine(34)-2'-O)-methyltransferase [Candidatus Cloacimonetes bacterium]|nr:tRNA (cytidine(34)-2'-O)-methyltransferase [Candidatus Cloacimonadota bacterium]